jgi:hypothetical protein
MTEAEFQAELIRYCRAKGWLAHACNDAWYCDGKGFPDVVIALPRVIVWAELKKDSMSRVRPEQTTWKYALQAAGEVYRRWTVRDWEFGYVQAELEGLLPA